MVVLFFFFFFQAEDGIRDDLVTGVQTCALPISRRPGAVQRAARRADRRPRAAARAPGLDPGPPRRGPVRALAGSPRLHERPQLRARLPPRDRHDARRVRRGRAGRTRADRARDGRPRRRGHRPSGRLRDRRDDAPRVPPAGRGEPDRLQRPIQEAGSMRIAIPLYDRFTALDAVGPYEVLSRLPGASVTWLAREPGILRTDNGMLGIEAD